MVDDQSLREFLFGNMNGCTNHDCIIRKPEGVGTNGNCRCLLQFSRGQISILQSKLEYLCKEDEKSDR